MREPSLQRPRHRSHRPARIDGLLILSGEDLLFDRVGDLLKGIHLPLFEAHFGPVWPREALEAGWRDSGFDRGGGSGARLARLAAMLSLVARGTEDEDRKRSLLAQARALWSWLALSRQHSTGGLARFLTSKGDLSRALAPALSFAVDLEARLRAFEPPLLRPSLEFLGEAMPRHLGLAAITGLPGAVVGAKSGGLRWWRIWDDGRRCPAISLAADLGIARNLGDEESSSRPRFDRGRLLLIGSRGGDLRLAKALGAGFVRVEYGLEDDALLGLARGFGAKIRATADQGEGRG